MKRRSFLALLALTPLGALIPKPKPVSKVLYLDGWVSAADMAKVFDHETLTPFEKKLFEKEGVRYIWPRRHIPHQIELKLAKP